MKELKIPFTFYDFFGYFLPGLVTMLIIIVLLSPSHDIDGLKPAAKTIQDIKLFPGLCIVLLCYAIGHLLSSISSFSLEKQLLGKRFAYKMPENRLFPSKAQEEPLFSEELTGKFKSIAEKEFKIKADEIKGKHRSEVFWLCNAVVVNECPNIYSRVFVFLSFYGFARTMSFIFGVSSLAFVGRLLLKLWVGPLFWEWSSLWILIACGLLCPVFFYEYVRFLKYHRQEIFYGFYNYATSERMANVDDEEATSKGE